MHQGLTLTIGTKATSSLCAEQLSPSWSPLPAEIIGASDESKSQLVGLSPRDNVPAPSPAARMGLQNSADPLC